MNGVAPENGDFAGGGSGAREWSTEHCSSSGAGAPMPVAGYRVLDRQRSGRQIAGGTRVADIISWKHRSVTIGVIISATLAWFLFERSGLSSLTICCDVVLILIVIQFIRVKTAALFRKHPKPLPELVLSEEMVNSAAASFRARLNNMLMMAHDITLGKDFRLFFQVVVLLWLLSVAGNLFSSFTILYAGFIALLTLPALYNKYEKHVDKYAGIVHRKFSEHYKIVDDSLIRQIPQHFIREKSE